MCVCVCGVCDSACECVRECVRMRARVRDRVYVCKKERERVCVCHCV